MYVLLQSLQMLLQADEGWSICPYITFYITYIYNIIVHLEIEHITVLYTDYIQTLLQRNETLMFIHFLPTYKVPFKKCKLYG
jgi:hypothetical protein